MIRECLEEIQKRMALAAAKSGRRAEDVTLVAVSKGQPAEKILEAIAAGQRDFGENYAQELIAHAAAAAATWHFIGHLQRNKVKSILPLVSLIHSVDSMELAREIDKRAAALGKIQPVLIEVNAAEETSKTGLAPKDVEAVVRAMNDLIHIDLRGLMGMPPPSHFRRLREIRDAINAQNVYKHPLSELSMGMTLDFEAAIEGGATIVRVGTGIFGERQKKEKT